MSTQSLVNGTHGVHAGGAATNGNTVARAGAPAIDLPATSRSRILLGELEEADTVLRLGEFEGDSTLSHAETKLLIETILHRRHQQAGRRPEETETLSKVMDWLTIFERFKSQDAVLAVDSLLNGYEGRLAAYERSQLATLCPTDGDEAFTLIPSLKAKFNLAEMDELTKQIADLRTFE